MDDIALLKQFADGNSEPAFAELISRHINLVYSTALRNVGDAHAAQEISQAVFIILARKAKSLGAKTIISGWLYQTARLTAANHLRAEMRRRNREQEAFMQSNLNEPQPDEVWNQIAPILDDSISKLGAKDRDAIVLRFFENKNLSEVGAALGASEDAAKMRVNRALEKLRKFFTKHGMTFSAAAIIGAVSANSIHAAPIGLAKTISAVAMTKGAMAGASTLTLVKGTLKLMALTKAKTVIVVGIGILLASGTATTIVVHDLKTEAVDIPEADKAWRFPGITSDTLDKLPPEVNILPTIFPNGGNFQTGFDDEKAVGIGQPVSKIIYIAYNWPQARMIFPDGEPTNHYDFITTLKQGAREALKQELKDKLGLVGHPKMKNEDALLLEMVNPRAPGLHPPTQGNYSYMHNDDIFSIHRREIKWANEPISKINDFLQSGSKWPIVDETGTTDRYRIDIKWEDDPQDSEHTALQKVLREQLGLELLPTNMPIEMLVVEKTN